MQIENELDNVKNNDFKTYSENNKKFKLLMVDAWNDVLNFVMYYKI